MDGEPRGAQKLDALLAPALLLPPLLLAWPGPGSLLRDDFLPQATGAGAVALASLPAAILVVARGAATGSRAVALFLAVLLATAGWLAFGRLTDSFEARRAAVRSTAALALLLGGASLSGPGLSTYARGLCGIAILLLAYAHVDTTNGLAGALGNTGSIAQAALPGAIVGAWLAFTAAGGWRLVGAAAGLLFLAYVARAPVIAGGLSIAVGLSAIALFRTGLPGRLRALWAAAALVAAAGVLGPLALHGRARPAEPEVVASGSSGGFEVRARIWSRSLAMLRDRIWIGVGPGQFAASFPPYRDPREIELSTHGRKIDAETEVEQPHEDWLAPPLELGIPAGLAWIGFLLAVAIAARRALRIADGGRAALGAGAFAILAYALVHGPLTQEPAAGSIAFVVFGAVLATPPARATRRWLPIAALVLLLASVPSALAFVRHGRALAGLAVPGERDAAEVGRSIEAALAACPDSTTALTLRARLDEERGADPAVIRAAWEKVLARRPERVEAWMQLALALLRGGHRAEARAAWEHAQRLDPEHPGIRRNLRLLDAGK